MKSSNYLAEFITMAEDVHVDNNQESFSPQIIQRQSSEVSNNKSVALGSNIHGSSPTSIENEIDSKLNASITVYDRLHLGLLMTLIKLVCKNIKIAVVTTICITTFLSGFDTTSDLYMVLFYLSQGLTILALSVILSDYISGLVVLLHYMNSEEWRNSCVKDKVFALLVLGSHPFSW